MAIEPMGAAEQRKLVHVSRMAVRWRDMDINRHVNNVVYFGYLEQARIEWFDTQIAQWRGGEFGTVVASAYCNYLKAIVYPETIEVCMYASVPGRSSFTIHYDVFRENDRTVKYADGYTRMVWIDRSTGRSQPLPENVRALLA